MVVLLLGSARLNRHIRIPFTIREKNTMTERAMTAAKSTRLSAENQNGTIMSAFAKLHNTYSFILWCPKFTCMLKRKESFGKLSFVCHYKLHSSALNVSQPVNTSSHIHSSFSYIISHSWNQLPSSVKSVTTLAELRTGLSCITTLGCKCNKCISIQL